MHYIVLFKFTDQGIKNIKGSPERVKKAKELFRKFGAEVKDFYLLLGQYDTAFIVQAPDDETMAKCNLAICALGNVRAETLRGFNEDEYQKICSALD